MSAGPSPRPGWHKWVYALLAVIAAAFLYLILDQLTNRVVRAEQTADASRAAATRLAEQVEGLGGTPVVDPSELPDPQRGERGDAGRDGLPGSAGAQGPQGPAGPQGPRGPRGFAGVAGAAGADGSDGANGADGQDGASVTGPIGPVGPQGPTGETGATGATGDRGPQGERGEQGPTGPTGPAGPTCPSGFTAAERTIASVEYPLGELMTVCVRDSEPAA